MPPSSHKNDGVIPSNTLWATSPWAGGLSFSECLETVHSNYSFMGRESHDFPCILKGTPDSMKRTYEPLTVNISISSEFQHWPEGRFKSAIHSLTHQNRGDRTLNVLHLDRSFTGTEHKVGTHLHSQGLGRDARVEL